MKGISAVFLPGLALWVFSASVCAQTQVPNEFQAGQPARAADVNENFDVLEQAIQQLEGETSSVNAQVKTAIPLASEARWLVDTYYRKRGALPLSNAEAGALALTEMSNDFVTSIAIGNGNVVATFGNNADSTIAGGSLEFVANTNGAGVYFTCNVSANVAAYFDQDSCVFVDEAPEPLMTIRKQFASAIPLASAVRWLVVNFNRFTGLFPANNTEAGAAVGESYRNQFVSSIAVGPGYIVTATYGDNAAAEIAGQTLAFVATDNGGSIDWICQTTVANRYSDFDGVSSPCVIDADAPPLLPTLIWRQIESGYPLAQGLQSLVEEYYTVNSVWPTNNAEVGATLPSTIINSFVTRVTVEGSGVVTITYGGASNANLLGSTVSFAPTDNGGSISWTCTALVEESLKPIDCRG